MAKKRTHEGNGHKARFVAPPIIERRAHGVFIVWIDTAPDGEAHADFADAFDAACSVLEGESDLAAVVLASRSPGFVAGADVPVLLTCGSVTDGESLARKGQKAMNRIAALPRPVVAAVHGPCLSGGLEMALACDARVASEDRRTVFGFPDVKLGLLPAAGGAARLPHVIGVARALDLLLSGRRASAKEALALGLVEEVVSTGAVLEAAIEKARWLAGRPDERPAHRSRLKRLLHAGERTLTDNPVGRQVVFEQARRLLFEETRGNYPAPRHIIEVVRTTMERGLEQGLEAEAKAFGRLVLTPEARQLMRLFLARRELRAEQVGALPSVEATALSRVGVVGAGREGAGFSYAAVACAELPVRLQDPRDEALLAALRHVRAGLEHDVVRGVLSRREADRRMHLLTPTPDLRGFEACDLVIEAVAGEIGDKQRVLREVEQRAPDDCVFASSAAVVPISELAATSRRPENVVGMHALPPVEKTSYVEVVAGRQSSPRAVAACVHLARLQGKTPIVVQDGVGFFTTRVALPFWYEALHILLEGVALERIDEALVRFGFRTGPFRMLDELGLDVALRAGRLAHEAYGERMATPRGLDRLVDEGRLGTKAGRGFYRYEKGHVEPDPSVPGRLGLEGNAKRASFDDIGWRCTLQLINEAARAYAEGVVASARDADIASVLGLGFPSFRGGPLRFVDTVSAAEVVRRLERYRTRLGPRFRPAPILVAQARQGGRFYEEGRLNVAAVPAPSGPPVATREAHP